MSKYGQTDEKCAKRKNESDSRLDPNMVKKPKIMIKLAVQSSSHSKNNKTSSPSPVKEEKASELSSFTKSTSNELAKAFGYDDEDEEKEEMPINAKMKMRNFGRETTTSTGPNSYGKFGCQGFVDSRKIIEKRILQKAEDMLKEEEKLKEKK